MGWSNWDTHMLICPYDHESSPHTHTRVCEREITMYQHWIIQFIKKKKKFGKNEQSVLYNDHI